MDSNIINAHAAKLAYEIAGYSHKPVEQVVMQAIEDLAERVLPKPKFASKDAEKRYYALKAISDHCASLSVLDWRDGDDILYDENGLPKSDKPLRERIMDIRKYCATLPVLDPRTPEEIIGYDENGLPPQ